NNGASGTVYLNNLASSITLNQNFTLMSYTNTTVPNLVLNSTYLGFDTVSLTRTTSSTYITVTNVPAAPAQAWFSGNASTAIWTTVLNTGANPVSNWNTDQSSNIGVGQLPGATTDVFLNT